MTSSKAVANLPEELRQAQKAVQLSEVQEMLRRLSKYNLGIFMPHIHDEDTGSFGSLPDGITQVEDGLQVSFHPESELVDEENRTYLPVGWYWRKGDTASMACVTRCVMAGTMHTVASHEPGPNDPGPREDEDEDEE